MQTQRLQNPPWNEEEHRYPRGKNEPSPESRGTNFLQSDPSIPRAPTSSPSSLPLTPFYFRNTATAREILPALSIFIVNLGVREGRDPPSRRWRDPTALTPGELRFEGTHILVGN